MKESLAFDYVRKVKDNILNNKTKRNINRKNKRIKIEKMM